jgi:hypothetical protein
MKLRNDGSLEDLREDVKRLLDLFLTGATNLR